MNGLATCEYPTQRLPTWSEVETIPHPYGKATKEQTVLKRPNAKRAGSEDYSRGSRTAA